MDSIIQTAMLVNTSTNLKKGWSEPNVNQEYMRLDPLGRATHLLRQSFLIKYCSIIYGKYLPPLIENYKKALANTIQIEIRNCRSKDIKVKFGLQTASTFIRLEDFIKFNSKNILSYFDDNSPANMKSNIPNIGESPFIEMCLNFWNNNLALSQRKFEDIETPLISGVKIPKIDITKNCILLNTEDTNYHFIGYVYSPELINTIYMNSPIDNNDTLCSLSASLDWNGKSFSNLLGFFARNVLTMDVFSPLKINTTQKNKLIQYRNLINASCFYVLFNDMYKSLINPTIFIKRNDPKIMDGFLKTIELLKTTYNLEMDDLGALNKLASASSEFGDFLFNKDNNNHVKSADGGTYPTILDGLEGLESEDETGSIEEPADDMEEDAPEPVVEADPVAPKEATSFRSKLKNDKSKKIKIELEKEVTLDVILLRDEFYEFITQILKNPEDKVDSLELRALKKIRDYWLNVLSIKTIYDIISSVVSCPIVIK